MANRTLIKLVLVAVAAGCGSPLEVGAADQATRMQNTRMQNTRMQNTRMQNTGTLQYGAPLALQGVITSSMQRLLVQPGPGEAPSLATSNLVAVPNVKVTASSLTDGDSSHGPAWFQGTVMKAVFWNAATSTQVAGYVYIDAVSTSPNFSDVMYYSLRAGHPFVPAPGDTCGDGGCGFVWEAACGNAKTPATALGGWWDFRSGVQGGGGKLLEQGSTLYDTYITFGCIDGAIGKCVDKLGYRPWRMAARECRQSGFFFYCQQPTQELLHEACVRMVRADYCGDGQDHTIDGMDLDVWDQSGINQQLPFTASTNSGGDPYGHEAEWTPNGARCLSKLMMPRISHPGSGETVMEYLMADATHAYCAGKWNAQLNQKYKPGWTSTNNANFNWADGDCFGIDQQQGRNIDLPGESLSRPVSAHSTFDFANTWSGMDMHDRVFIKEKAVCIDDSGNSASASNYNGYKYSWPWCAECLYQPIRNAPACSPPYNF